MKNNNSQQLLLIVACIVFPLRTASAQFEFGERAIIFRMESNPFKQDYSINANVRLVDKASPSVGWFSRQLHSKVNNKTELERDSILRIMGASKELSSQIDNVFQARIKAHEANLEPLKAHLASEKDNIFELHGLAPRFATLSIQKPNEHISLKEALLEYELQEGRAERLCISQINELLPPRRFEVLIRKWLSINYLYMPISAEFLELTDDQVRVIKERCIERQKVEFALSGNYKGNDLSKRNQIFLESQEWHEATYRPFAEMEPNQFLKAAKFLLKSWKGDQSFSKRLIELQSDNSLQSKCELSVLGELYKRGSK